MDEEQLNDIVNYLNSYNSVRVSCLKINSSGQTCLHWSNDDFYLDGGVLKFKHGHCGACNLFCQDKLEFLRFRGEMSSNQSGVSQVNPEHLVWRSRENRQDDPTKTDSATLIKMLVKALNGPNTGFGGGCFTESCFAVANGRLVTLSIPIRPIGNQRLAEHEIIIIKQYEKAIKASRT